MILHCTILLDTITGACGVNVRDHSDKPILSVHFERGSFVLPDFGEILRLVTQGMREARQKETP